MYGKLYRIVHLGEVRMTCSINVLELAANEEGCYSHYRLFQPEDIKIMKKTLIMVYWNHCMNK